MNLHQIVSGAVGFVNPFIPAIYTASAGYTTNTAGKQIPGYAAPVTVSVQRQALTAENIRQLDNMNIQGVTTSLFLNGHANGVVRVTAKGGDLFQFDGQTWLVVAVPEQWPDWVKVLCVLQNGS